MTTTRTAPQSPRQPQEQPGDPPASLRASLSKYTLHIE